MLVIGRSGNVGGSALWRASARLQSGVGGNTDAPIGHLFIRSVAFLFLVLSFVSHRESRATPPAYRYRQFSVSPDNTVYSTLPLARAKEDSAATPPVTSTIPALCGGQRFSPRSSQYPSAGSYLYHGIVPFPTFPLYTIPLRDIPSLPLLPAVVTALPGVVRASN